MTDATSSRAPREGVSKREKRRSEILDAAAAVFAEKGYYAATIQDIADRLGMRAGSLYYHLASKEEALAEVCRLGGLAFLDRIKTLLSSGRPVRELIREATRLHLDARWRDYVSNFTVNRGMLPPAVREEMDGIARDYLAAWAQLIARGQEDGVLDHVIDSRTAAAALLAICNGAASAAPDGASLDVVADRVNRLFLYGMAAR